MNIKIPENMVLLPIPPYSPELNPVEKMWKWFKSKVAMKLYQIIDDLEEKITAYEYLIKSYYSIFY